MNCLLPGKLNLVPFIVTARGWPSDADAWTSALTSMQLSHTSGSFLGPLDLTVRHTKACIWSPLP